MRHRRGFVTAILWAVLVGMAGPVAHADAQNRVFGSVTAGGEPVANARIYVYAGCGQPVVHSADVVNGRYEIFLPDGKYKAEISIRDMQQGYGSWNDAKLDCDTADWITISGNTEVNVRAMAASTVSGSVASADGRPVSASLYFIPAHKCQDSQWGIAWGSASVNPHAGPHSHYAIRVPDGKYKVAIYADTGKGDTFRSWNSGRTSCSKAETITVSGDTQHDLVAILSSYVTGSVSVGGVALGAARVEFYESCEAWRAHDEPVNQGESPKPPPNAAYATHVPNGTYKVRITTDARSGGFGSYSSWHDGQRNCEDARTVTVSGDGIIDLRAKPALESRVRIRSAFGPLPSTKHQLIRLTLFQTCEDARSDNVSAMADSFNDTFRIWALDGTYLAHIAVENPVDTSANRYSWHRAAESCEGATPITISGADLELIAKSSQAPKPRPQSATGFSVKRIEAGKKVKAPTHTRQGSKITWRSTTRRICVVKRSRVQSLRKGICKLKGTAPGSAELLAFSARVKIRVI